MKNRFDLIIFDWDGTLVDSIDWIVHCLKKAAKSQGCNILDEQAAKDTIGLSLPKAAEQLIPDLDQISQEQFIACYSQEYLSKPISENDLFVGVDKMLAKFKQTGYQLAVATGKRQLELDKAMYGTGVGEFFNTTRSADQTASKPHPCMLEEIIKEIGVSKERALLVGDSVHDMQMANNAGISSVAVSCGANTSEQLQTFNPLLNLTQTTELLKVL